jgi:hypothetical protein
LHRFFHTLLGASLVIGAVVAGYAVVRWMNGRRRSQDRREGGRPTHLPVVVGAVLGGGSHILLDCIMHHDIRPFAPFSMANPLLGLMSTAALHWWCLATGGIGLAVLAVRRLIGRS